MMPDSCLKLIGIPISLRQLEREPGSPGSTREVFVLPWQTSRRFLRCPMELDSRPDVIEKTWALKDDPHHNSRTYPRFPPQLQKNYETSPSPQYETRFLCIVWRTILCSQPNTWRTIPCSQSNTEGALICIMELQRIPKNTVSNLEGEWCHHRNVK